MEKDENNHIKNIEFLHNISREKYNFLMDNIDKLDQKFTTLFSVNVIIISIIFSLNVIKQTALFFMGLTLIIVAVIIAVIGYIPKVFRDVAIDKLWEKNYNTDYKTTIESITSAIIEAYKTNKNVQDIKSERVILAFVFSLSGIVIIALSQIIIF